MSQAAEALTLFPPSFHVEALPASTEVEVGRLSVEHLQTAEKYLDEKSALYPALAPIEAAAFLCESVGPMSARTLRGLEIDSTAFPRSAAAVDHTCTLLTRPRTEWPDGFWPRFVLRLLDEGQPSA